MQPATDGALDVAALLARIERLEALLLGADRWVSVGEAARLLRVHRSTVHDWVTNGNAPARRWRGRWELDPTWVATTAAARRTQTQGHTPCTPTS